jgi:hypothetical protein
MALSRRRWPILLAGTAIGMALAIVAFGHVSSKGVTPRSPSVKSANATIFVTQNGVPWARSALTEYIKAVGANTSQANVPRFADEQRVQYLAELYANLAVSDPVRVPLEKRGLVGPDSYTAEVIQSGNGEPLPLISITTRSTDAARAITLANQVASNLRNYIQKRQDAEKIATQQRIQLVVVSRARQAVVVEGTKFIAPMMIFSVVLFLALVAAAVVDNRRRPAGAVNRDEKIPEVLDFDPRKPGPKNDAAPEHAGGTASLVASGHKPATTRRNRTRTLGEDSSRYGGESQERVG